MELEKGKRYWCGWASRYATYVSYKNGLHIFKDITGSCIRCKDEYINKWVREQAQ